MLHRQALILRAATFPLNDKDRQRLKVCLLHNLWFPACPYSALLLISSLFIPHPCFTLYTSHPEAADGGKSKLVHAVSQVAVVLACMIGSLMPCTVLVVS